MDSNMDMSQGDGEQPFVPFTKAERIQQLGEIDESIVSLLRTMGKAIESLGTHNTSTGGDTAMVDQDGADLTVFEGSVKNFLRTLHSVDVRMKRQIWGLEEAGIVSSDNKDEDEETGRARTKKVLEPDGCGKIGGLDVGWLNSRSNKVERDMEAELWSQSEVFLRRMLENGKYTAS